MGMLVKGVWQDQDLKDFERNGKNVRFQSGFHNKVQKDDSSSFIPEVGRYALYFNVTCPWSHRATIVRQLKGLSHVIDAVLLEPAMGQQSWWFGSTGNYPDPAMNATHLHELYTATEETFTGRVSIPVLWDKIQRKIVNNDSAMIARMFNNEFNEFALKPDLDFYPSKHKAVLDRLNNLVADKLNDGIYRCLLANNQNLYEQAFDSIFFTLDSLENTLRGQRYLVCDHPTEPDWRFFAFLIRFDAVYYSLYKCNLRRIADYPNLFAYTKDLYQMPGIAETVDLPAIKHGYYKTVDRRAIVPKGPNLNLLEPHDRERITSYHGPIRSEK